MGNDNIKRYERTTGANISYSSSAGLVVFGGHLSARAVFRLDLALALTGVALQSTLLNQRIFHPGL